MQKMMIYAAAFALTSALAHAETLVEAKARIESDYQNDLAVCAELGKSEQPGCKKDAATTRKTAYKTAWQAWQAPTSAQVYPPPYASAKAQIDKDYKARVAFCTQLDKPDAGTCQKAALNAQKASLKLALANKNAPPCPNCGVITAVNEVEKPGEGSLLGKIGGAVVGGVLGNQVGKGNGRTVATVIGAIGGGLAGNEIEKQVTKKKYYEVTFKLDSGESKTVAFDSSEHGFRVGDKIKFENDQLIPR
ncbi:Glycine zipper 2TM domain-containing protein [Andreprevotia lacus DSM 23236]|jgi:outer membrane lipoprotein SlyB|uniref:Glycine zipper 2TM domain-containing protein n=1 Tax=Andreprevotia lacus DSM 23236 TaxID=1121001 RepID=A0A1W1XK19_9NEIS|nr:glycine zipper 2TM domain-containing protein [Andreprevotia lacus]SMC24326.1 Glycine zipper 2TM domain-containing protein [Andreprevotia lacus DSM 23236]